MCKWVDWVDIFFSLKTDLIDSAIYFLLKFVLRFIIFY